MRKNIKTHTFFNLGTQRALYEKVDGYINKEVYIKEHIAEIKNKYGLDNILRFDLGQNNDGCDKKVSEFIKNYLNEDARNNIKNYPEFICRDLRKKIADFHNISSDWIVLSAGLEQMIIMIASTFLELNDRIVINAPSFYLFEEYSKRMGAISVTLRLKEEDGYKWTNEIFKEYSEILDKLHPKLIWIANPNNPTGASIPMSQLDRIIQEASKHYTFIVIDEAYGEYTDPDGKVISASSFLKDYNNLIVLRTFSKAYGLANLRVGYAMTNDKDIIKAIKIHNTNFPITQFSYDVVNCALQNIDYLKEVRNETKIRKTFLLSEIKKIKNITFIDSETNIMMLKHQKLSSNEFIKILEKNGIIVARIPFEDEPNKNYIRITMGTEFENQYFIDVLKKI